MFRLVVHDHDSCSEVWSNVQVIHIACKGIIGYSGLNVCVEKNSTPFQLIKICRDSNEYFFRSDAIVWLKFAAIGYGQKLYLVALDAPDTSPSVIDLDGYFGYFHSTDKRLFVASERHLLSLNPKGEVEWIARNVGIDGVIIEKVEDDFVFGLGEFDPPNGWKKFRIKQLNGEIHWS